MKNKRSFEPVKSKICLLTIILSLVCIFFTITCAAPKKGILNSRSNYIYLSHTRLQTNDSIFKKIYDINMNLYDMTLLGGDLGVSTFKDSIIHHLDKVFDLRNKNTLWSIGNHDNTSNENFKRFTNKNKFHYYVKDETTFITINSQDSLSSIVGKQKKEFFNILNTLRTKNVVILSHKLIFMDQHPIMDSQINQVCNGPKGICDYCHNSNNFQSEIYPKLLQIKKSGKNIIWIGGDLGAKASKFEYVDKNGVIFLGNGFWFMNKNNHLLLLSNYKNEINYKFIAIDTLIKHQSSKYINSLFSN